ncbi:MAG: L-seryl-tRNA(Sec) selenium transferase [Clostridia bacterium]|nr:L-seryl-tRNA(Sec) selenium transferase [Clostridia bacterium]
MKQNERHMNKELLRKLPKIDELTNNEKITGFLDNITREQISIKARQVVDKMRKDILAGNITQASEVSFAAAVDALAESLMEDCNSLRRVVNATGVVLHTNLGRANLCASAKQAVNDVCSAYSTIEYDPAAGRRGSRHSHVEELITSLTGAEAAMVVNNNAAAVMLAMATLGRGYEMIVSRGELVEIGGSFRVPDIMAESGVTLVEAGTTNKTKISDYEKNINENTKALMKVHTSNFAIVGFTEEVSVKELKALGQKYDIPVIYDVGSGLLADLEPYGIQEPGVKKGLEDGADVILFSGDKMLGGPQAGIIAGKAEYIAQMKAHPLARVLRVDKMTLSALEATLKEYQSPENALKNIPVLRELTASKSELEEKACALKQVIEDACGFAKAEIVMDEGIVGGGSAPLVRLENPVLAVECEGKSANELEEYLRAGKVPVIGRIRNDKLVLDVRTIFEEDYEIIGEKFGKL